MLKSDYLMPTLEIAPFDPDTHLLDDYYRRLPVLGNSLAVVFSEIMKGRKKALSSPPQYFVDEDEMKKLT